MHLLYIFPCPFSSEKLIRLLGKYFFKELLLKSLKTIAEAVLWWQSWWLTTCKLLHKYISSILTINFHKAVIKYPTSQTLTFQTLTFQTLTFQTNLNERLLRIPFFQPKMSLFIKNWFILIMIYLDSQNVNKKCLLVSRYDCKITKYFAKIPKNSVFGKSLQEYLSLIIGLVNTKVTLHVHICIFSQFSNISKFQVFIRN